MSTKNKIVISAILISLGVACRLLPHLWNFAPVAAVALFAGIYLGKKHAIVLPLITMAAGDLFLGFYDWRLMLAVYSSLIVVGLLGILIRKHKSLETIVAASILGSVWFFVVTNWVVWYFSPWYAKNLAGLIECYTLALPFFRNTLIGDLFYALVLFGAYEAVLIAVRKKRLVAVLAKNG